MFLSREIEIKLCQNYTKTYIYEIKQTIFNKYATIMKITIIPQEPENLRFVPVIFFYFLFCIFNIDIIDNIITYSLYSPYYVTRTSANSSAVSLSRVSVFVEYMICLILRILFKISYINVLV